jgi:hypothetical protein
MDVSGQHHAPAALYPRRKDPPGTHCTGGWVGPRAGLDAEARGKILCLCRGSNLGRPVCSQILYLLSYPGSVYTFTNNNNNPKNFTELRNVDRMTWSSGQNSCHVSGESWVRKSDGGWAKLKVCFWFQEVHVAKCRGSVTNHTTAPSSPQL